MKDLNKQYEIAKQQARTFMQNGQLNAYFKTLLKMNNYKRLMTAIVAN